MFRCFVIEIIKGEFIVSERYLFIFEFVFEGYFDKIVD